ncbi:MAG: alpha/beta hydrolase [Actinomycetota bacterium]|nr:alpha/beta hydrolase [Actinomycetota bacterium]
MPLDQQIAKMLQEFEAGDASRISERSVTDMRGIMASVALRLSEPGADVASVRMVEVPTAAGTVPTRLYRPLGAAPEPLGALVWMHGGGFVTGDLESADPTARDLCAGAGLAVISVDYPLAPEHPFPAAPESCLGVTAWVVDHAEELGLDPGRIAVGGDNAGANLAATISQMARDRGRPPVAFQLLVYPVVDHLASFPSVNENGEGYLLTADAMAWFSSHYAGRADIDDRDPMMSPIYAADLAGLPPALVITAEFDPLRDEGEAYAMRLRQAGVPVQTTRYDGMIHGFFTMTKITPRAREAAGEAVGALRMALA